MSNFCSVPQAIKEIRRGNMLIVVDSPKRENEGDLYFPADLVTPQKVNFMIKNGGGLICVAITRSQAARFELPLMVEPVHNTEKTGINFSISVNAAQGITTGISAYDRAKTIKVLATPSPKPSHLTRPGHVFPLIAEDEGILKRPGHTEAAVTLSTLAGFHPLGVLCEILRSDGKMARIDDLVTLASTFNLKIVSIKDLVSYIKKRPLGNSSHTRSTVRVASSLLPTMYGTFEIIIYQSLLDRREHAVLRMRQKQTPPTLVRIHSQCLTGDTFLSLKCDCREQLYRSMKLIRQNKSGLIIYLNQEGRGIGLSNKIKAYRLQEKGLDTVEANQALHLPIDARDYQIAAEILHDLGISSINLLTNNPQKVKQLRRWGIIVTQRLPLEISPHPYNRHYLSTKKRKLYHLLAQV